MMRRIRRLVRTTDRATLRQVTFGMGAVLVMVAVGVALQAGRDGGPSSADATPIAPGGSTTSAASTPATGTAPPSTTEPTGPVPAPRIDRFEVPARVACGTVTSIEARWATSHAVAVKLDVDASGAFEFGAPDGASRLPFPCDGGAHTYRVVAVGADGTEVSRVRRVDQAP